MCTPCRHLFFSSASLSWMEVKKAQKQKNTSIYSKRHWKNIKLENARLWRIHGFWFKKFTSIHDRLALEMNRCLQGAHVLEWITKGKTTFIQKDQSKRTDPHNYKPITSLPMMWKILTAQIREEIYYSLTSFGLFSEEQKDGTKDPEAQQLFYIDQYILNESKTRQKNLAMAWIDYKKGIWNGLAKLDNKLPQNVQNIRWSHKLYQENHKNLESGIDSKRKKLSWSKDPKMYFSRRCTITVIVHNFDDATSPHTKKIHSRIQT